jgi:predicted deacetylase
MDGFINIAIHDVHVGNGDVIRDIAERADRASLGPLSFMVVPSYERRFHLTGDSELAGFLRGRARRGDEIVYHGTTHRNEHGVSPAAPLSWFHDRVALGVGEFASEWEGLDRYVVEGISRLGCLDAPIRGAVPPGWLGTDGFLRACGDAGLKFATSVFFLHDLEGRRKLFSPVITTLNSGSEKEYRCLRALYEAAWPVYRRLALWRIAIHPNDVALSRFDDFIDRLTGWCRRRRPITLETAGRTVRRSWRTEP